MFALSRIATADLSRLRRESEGVSAGLSRLREEILDAFSRRLEASARDVRGFEALDARAVGALSSRTCLDGLAARSVRAHDRHRGAVADAGRAGERYLACVAQAEDSDRECLDLGAGAETARLAVEGFDPAFKAAFKVVSEAGVDDATLLRPGFRMIESRVRAARAAVKGYARTGADYFEVRDTGYLPLHAEWRQAGQAWDAARLRQAESDRLRREAERAVGATEGVRKEARRELGVAVDEEREPMPALRGMARRRLSAVLLSAGDGKGSPAPLARLAEAGLLTAGDLAAAGRCAALAQAHAGLERQTVAQVRLVRQLDEAHSKLDRGVRKGAGSQTARVDLAEIRRAVEGRTKSLDGLLDGIGTIRAPGRQVHAGDDLQPSAMPDMVTWGMLYALADPDLSLGTDAGAKGLDAMLGQGDLSGTGLSDVRFDVPDVRVDVPDIRVDIPEIRADIPVDIGGSSYSAPTSFGMD